MLQPLCLCDALMPLLYSEYVKQLVQVDLETHRELCNALITLSYHNNCPQVSNPVDPQTCYLSLTEH